MKSSNSSLPDNFDYTYFSLNVLSQAITEMEILTKGRPSHELNLFNGHLGNFYYFNLTYVFVMEFCKLMESKRKRKSNHYASLAFLNEKVYNLKGKSYLSTYREVQHELSVLQQSDIYNFVKNDLRDKRLAHTDKFSSSESSPFNFPALTDQRMTAIKNACNSMWSIQNKAAEPFEVEFSNHTDDTTQNVIKLYGAYFKYCHESGDLTQILSGY